MRILIRKYSFIPRPDHTRTVWVLHTLIGRFKMILKGYGSVQSVSHIHFDKYSAPYSSFADEVLSSADWSVQIPVDDLVLFAQGLSGWAAMHRALTRGLGMALRAQFEPSLKTYGPRPANPIPRIGILTQQDFDTMAPLDVLYAAVAEMIYHEGRT